MRKRPLFFVDRDHPYATEAFFHDSAHEAALFCDQLFHFAIGSVEVRLGSSSCVSFFARVRPPPVPLGGVD